MITFLTRPTCAVAALCLVCICTCTSFASGPRAIPFKTTAGPIERKADSLAWPAEPPQRMTRVAPTYPEGVADGTGVVTMQVTIGTDGRVAELRALELAVTGALVNGLDEDAGRAFAAAATAAVNAWQYEVPASGPVTFLANLVIRPGGADTPANTAALEPRIKGTDRQVRKTKDVAPTYPAVARAQRIQGVVVLEATVAPDGRVMDCRVLRDIPYLDKAALDAVAQWEFDPEPLFSTRAQGTRTLELMLNFRLP